MSIQTQTNPEISYQTQRSSNNNTNQYVKDKISTLEENILILANQLNAEIASRKLMEEKTVRTDEYLHKKIDSLSSYFKHYDVEISKNFEKLHYDITNDMNNKNNHLIDYIQTNNDSIINQTNKSITATNISNSNNINHSNLNPLTSINPNFTSYIDKEFKQYRTELSNLITQMNSIEINTDNQIKVISSQIKNLQNDVTFLRSNIESILNKNNTYENTQISFQSEINSNFKNIYEALNKINKDNHEEKEEKLKAIVCEQNKKNEFFEKTITDMLNKIQLFSVDLNNKLRLLKENLHTQLNNQNKEINHFQHNIITEYESLSKKLHNTLADRENTIKNMYEYTNGDIELIRSRNQYIENSINKLRSDIYDSIKQTEMFLLQKMDNTSKELATNANNASNGIMCQCCKCPCQCDMVINTNSTNIMQNTGK